MAAVKEEGKFSWWKKRRTQEVIWKQVIGGRDQEKVSRIENCW